MRYRIGIYDYDSCYAIGLMEYINTHRDYSIQSIAFTTEEAMLRHMDQAVFDMILCTGCQRHPVGEHTECKVVRLSETDEPEYEGEPYIFKYQCAETLVHHILSILQTAGRRLADGTAFYGVYSPVGRCGRTTFAFGICHTVANSLYVGMDSYIGSTIIADETFSRSELFFYRLMTHNRQITETISDGRIAGDFFSVIYGLRCFTDYRQIAAGDFQWLRQVLDEDGTVSCVVFDIGSGALSDLELLSVFDRIFVPCLSDTYSMRRLEHFRLLMRGGEYRRIADRISYVEVPAETYDSPCMQEYVRRKLASV